MKLVSLLAKMSQGDRNLILFLAGRVFKKQGGLKAGGKLASSASASKMSRPTSFPSDGGFHAFALCFHPCCCLLCLFVG
jgi:hypothetical protein